MTSNIMVSELENLSQGGTKSFMLSRGQAGVCELETRNEKEHPSPVTPPPPRPPHHSQAHQLHEIHPLSWKPVETRISH